MFLLSYVPCIPFWDAIVARDPGDIDPCRVCLIRPQQCGPIGRGESQATALGGPKAGAGHLRRAERGLP